MTGVQTCALPICTDLGLWNVFANPQIAKPQAQLALVLAESGARGTPAEVIEKTIARFKTSGLRDLGHSAPYLHNGAKDTLEDVVKFYAASSALAREGALRNAAPELRSVFLTPGDAEPLAAFLRSLNEDYE